VLHPVAAVVCRTLLRTAGPEHEAVLRAMCCKKTRSTQAHILSLVSILACRDADGTEAVQLPWPTDDAPTFDAFWLQDMEGSYDPTVTETPGAEVGVTASSCDGCDRNICML